MDFSFVDCKSDLSYVTLLARITFKYCNNHDGRIYATYSTSRTNNNLVEILISQLTPLMLNKKNAIILNLLVNPFFDDLCDYLSKNPKISKMKINLIKKYVFSYLSDPNTRRIYSDLEVEGAEIYIRQNMCEKSKKMLKELQYLN